MPWCEVSLGQRRFRFGEFTTNTERCSVPLDICGHAKKIANGYCAGWCWKPRDCSFEVRHEEAQARHVRVERMRRRVLEGAWTQSEEQFCSGLLGFESSFLYDASLEVGNNRRPDVRYTCGERNRMTEQLCRTPVSAREFWDPLKESCIGFQFAHNVRNVRYTCNSTRQQTGTQQTTSSPPAAGRLHSRISSRYCSP